MGWGRGRVRCGIVEGEKVGSLLVPTAVYTIKYRHAHQQWSASSMSTEHTTGTSPVALAITTATKGTCGSLKVNPSSSFHRLPGESLYSFCTIRGDIIHGAPFMERGNIM